MPAVATDTQTVNAAGGANPAPIGKTVTCIYDPAGNVTSIVYPSGRKLHIAYSGGMPSAMALARNASATPTTLASAILRRGPARARAKARMVSMLATMALCLRLRSAAPAIRRPQPC